MRTQPTKLRGRPVPNSDGGACGSLCSPRKFPGLLSLLVSTRAASSEASSPPSSSPGGPLASPWAGRELSVGFGVSFTTPAEPTPTFAPTGSAAATTGSCGLSEPVRNRICSARTRESWPIVHDKNGEKMPGP
eukprot:scaffold707_cov240-Pinguiococcus_pyrenoidosus.AAC.4